MNWDAIGAIGEIVGALAVVLSLAYLAIQIRVSNRAAKNSTGQEMMNKYSAVYSQFGSSTETSEIYLRGLIDDETLPPAELFQFRSLLVQSVLAMERIYYLNKEQEIDPWMVEGAEHIRKTTAGSPGFQRWFNDRKEVLSKEFQGVLENEIEMAPVYKPLGIDLKGTKYDKP